MSPSYQDAPDLSTPASTSAVAQQKNGGLMAITVVCLILGLLGLLTSIFGLTMLPSQETISQMQSGQPGILGDFQVKMAEIQQSQFIPNLVVIGLNLIVGTLLIIGSIDVLKTRNGDATYFETHCWQQPFLLYCAESTTSGLKSGLNTA